MSKRSSSASPRKPAAKPKLKFPLWKHPSGRWCRKFGKRAFYFGRVDEDPEGTAALARMLREWPFVVDGRIPPADVHSDDADGPCTIKRLCNRFLGKKRAAVDSGELMLRSFGDYVRTCDAIVVHFGKDRRVDDLRSDDFASFRSALAKRLGPTALGNEIIRCRSVFKAAFTDRLIDRPVHFGDSFAKPRPKLLRKARNEAGPRMFSADEIHRVLAACKSNPVMRAMTLLGLNAGLGNSDIANLPQSAIDWEGGWLDYPRPKTEVPRRIPLWAETLDALREAIARRPKAKESADEDLVFLTAKMRQRWVRTKVKPGKRKGDSETIVPLDALGQTFRKLLDSLGINGSRNFYTLRRVFETVAGESKDQVAVDACMGHCDNSMAAVYRQGISDERLRAVVAVVHGWVFGDAPATEGGAA